MEEGGGEEEGTPVVVVVVGGVLRTAPRKWWSKALESTRTLSYVCPLATKDQHTSMDQWMPLVAVSASCELLYMLQYQSQHALAIFHAFL